jgi:hypothetical protein
MAALRVQKVYFFGGMGCGSVFGGMGCGSVRDSGTARLSLISTSSCKKHIVSSVLTWVKRL